MKKKNIFRVGLVLALGLALLSGCGKTDKKEKAASKGNSKQVLRVVENAELPTMDISNATDVVSFSAISQVMEGLYEFEDDSTSKPAIAKEVVEPTNDGKTYTIEMNKDSQWSNGEKVTAHDFIYSWQRTVDPTTGSEYAYLFEGFENYQDVVDGKKEPTELGVKALDDYTIEINLEYPIPYLSSMLAKPTYYPQNKKFVEEQGKDYGTNSDAVIYNGPFTLEEWDGTGLTWKYVKNSKFRKKDKVQLDEINIQVVKDVATSLNLFNADDADIIPIKGEYAQQEADNEDLVLREYPGIYYMQYNFENKVFGNLNARKAISSVLDSKQLTEHVLGDGSKPVAGLVPTGILNVETGKDFSKEAGILLKTDIPKGKEYWEKAKAELNTDKEKITVLASDTDSAKKLAEYVQGVLSSNLEGLEVNVSTVPFNNRLDAMSRGDFDVVLAGWSATYADPNDFLQMFNVGNSLNYGKWENQEYAKLLKDASSTYVNDNEKRWDTLLEAHKLLMDELPITPLYQSSESYLVKPEVKGLVYRALGSPYYKNISMNNK